MNDTLTSTVRAILIFYYQLPEKVPRVYFFGECRRSAATGQAEEEYNSRGFIELEAPRSRDSFLKYVLLWPLVLHSLQTAAVRGFNELTRKLPYSGAGHQSI